jgi:hypothetical protein
MISDFNKLLEIILQCILSVSVCIYNVWLTKIIVYSCTTPWILDISSTYYLHRPSVLQLQKCRGLRNFLVYSYTTHALGSLGTLINYKIKWIQTHVRNSSANHREGIEAGERNSRRRSRGSNNERRRGTDGRQDRDTGASTSHWGLCGTQVRSPTSTATVGCWAFGMTSRRARSTRTVS